MGIEELIGGEPQFFPAQSILPDRRLLLREPYSQRDISIFIEGLSWLPRFGE